MKSNKHTKCIIKKKMKNTLDYSTKQKTSGGYSINAEHMINSHRPKHAHAHTDAHSFSVILTKYQKYPPFT